MTGSMDGKVRVYTVVNWRTERVHGMTCNINQSAAWVREICESYGNNWLAATQCVDVVDPAEQNIPWQKGLEPQAADA